MAREGDHDQEGSAVMQSVRTTVNGRNSTVRTSVIECGGMLNTSVVMALGCSL